MVGKTLFFPDFLPPREPAPELHEGLEVTPNCRLVRRLGEGAAGLVWVAHEAHGERVRELVVKVTRRPRPHGNLDAEIQMLAELSGNIGVVQKIDEGEIVQGDQSYHWFSMPLLERLLEPDADRSVDACVDLMRACSDRVQELHDRGMVHRDLKLAHVYLTENDQPMLIDFGIADRAATGSERRPSIAGTPPYIAPEVLDGEAGLHGRQDVFSLGVILWELLAGEPPFPRFSSLTEAIAWWEEHRHAAEPSRIAGVPRSLTDVALRATHPDPAQRFQSVRELSAALKYFRERRLRRGKQAVAALLVILSATAAIGWWRANQLGGEVSGTAVHLAGVVLDAARAEQPLHKAYETKEWMRESLDESEGLLEILADRHPSNEDLLHANAVIADAVGFVQYRIGALETALGLFQRATRTGERLTLLFPDEKIHAENLVRATLRMALVQEELGRANTARDSLSTAERRIEAADARFGDDWIVPNNRSEVLNNIGNLHRNLGNYAAACLAFTAIEALLPALDSAELKTTRDWAILEFLILDCGQLAGVLDEPAQERHQKALCAALARWDAQGFGEDVAIEQVRAAAPWEGSVAPVDPDLLEKSD